ncbi:MAG: ATP-binding protein [Chloroflexi bacterium]|nr:ATP-binding protein [Chloroflexota bacterium]
MESSLSHLAAIAEFVADGARQAGLSEEEVFAVQMAADEACTNSIEHAYGGQEGEVRICCWAEGNEYVVRITDFGRPFDPDSVPIPDTKAPLTERNIGGLGLFFMRELVDQVDFASDPIQGNQVTLRKRRHAEF